MTPIFTWPTVQRAVSSGFTDKRGYGVHAAIDIPAPIGSPVRTIGRGRVAFSGDAGDCGSAVFIDHDLVWRSHYCHLNLRRVSAGDVVGIAEHIGDVGATGAALGPHLHLNLFTRVLPKRQPYVYVDWVKAWAVDPLVYLREEDDLDYDTLVRLLRSDEALQANVSGAAVRGGEVTKVVRAVMKAHLAEGGHGGDVDVDAVVAEIAERLED